MSETTPTGSDTMGGIRDARLVHDGITNRVLLGYDKDGFGTGNDYGIKVSKAGFDVLTAADSNLILSSAFNSFKIVTTGNVSLTIPNATGSVSVSVAHGLSAPPMVVAAYLAPAGAVYHPLPYFTQGAYSGGNLTLTSWVRWDVDGTNVIFSYDQSTIVTFGTASIRYYILQETAS